MNRALYRHLILIVFLAFSTMTARAQDFQRSYQLGADGSVSIKNVSGNIAVTGYDGTAVTVSGYKEGRDRDMVDVEDMSAGNKVDLRVKYSEGCRQGCNSSIRFEVRVPRSMNINLDKLSTASGDIEVSGMQGRMRLNSASGNVSVRDVAGTVNASTASGNVRITNVSGTVSANSASGNVEAEIARLDGAESMKFSTASGDVHVRMPSSIDADVEMSTLSGKVDTDFPLEVQERQYGPGSRARGRIGSGSRSLRISSASGNVSLKNYPGAR